MDAVRILLKSMEGPDGQVEPKMVYSVLQMARPHVFPFLKAQMASQLSAVGDAQCAGAMAALVDGVASDAPELWALRMLDASAQLPQGLLAGGAALPGAFDECRAARPPAFAPQHCLLTLCLSRGAPCAQGSLEASARLLRALQGAEAPGGGAALRAAAEGVPWRVGVCAPAACGAADVRALAAAALQPLGAGLRVELEAARCRAAGDDAFGAADYWALGLVLAIAVWCAFASVYDYCSRGARRREWVVAFSVLANGAALLHVGAEGRDALPPLHALRVLAFAAVVLGHRCLFHLDFPTDNLEDMAEALKTRAAVFVSAAPLAVDAFLLLGGLLVAYVFFNHTARGGPFKLLPFYLYRYFRLAPALGLVILLESTVLMKMSDGPMWSLQDHHCSETWWYIMLHICNYFRPNTVKCMGHTWYLSADWQLFLLAPLALLALRRAPRAAAAALAALALAGVALRFAVALRHGVRYSVSATTDDGMRLLYYPAHARFQPYATGIVLGYALHRLKRRPAPLPLTQAQLWALWAAAGALGGGAVYGMWRCGDPDRPYRRLLESAFVAAVHSAVGLALAIVVFLVVNGNGGCLGRVLSHRWWRPLSRLTFCMYLVHMPVQTSLLWSGRAVSSFSIWGVVTGAAAVWLLSVPPAALLALLWESPVVQLGRLLLAAHTNKQRLKKSEPFDKDGAAAPNRALRADFEEERDLRDALIQIKT